MYEACSLALPLGGKLSKVFPHKLGAYQAAKLPLEADWAH